VLLSGLLSFLTLGLAGCGTSTPPSIAVTLSPSSAQSIDQAQTVPLTVTVTNDSKSAGVTWSVSGGGTLSAQNTSSATYQAPASVTTAITATVTATSITDTTKTATLQIKVSPPPTFSITSLPAATAGISYSQTLTVSGGTSPYTWAITSGTLPAGLSFSTSTGAITGTPTGGGSTVTIRVTDAAKMSASQTFTITVNAPSALTITTTTLSAGTTGTAYSQTLQATGGVPSYTWSKTAGSLPGGLSLSSSGVISGTPSGTFTGTSSFTVSLTDSQTPTHTTTTAILSITVSAPPLSVTTTSLAGGTIGNAYSSQTLQATGGIAPYTWAVTTGSLPAGLTLNAATGVISGTPSGTFVGTDTFAVTVTDSETLTAKTATASLGIAISVSALSVTTSGSLATGVVNSVYPGATLAATGGITPYSWAVTTGSLPAGLTLNAATGAISGTPTAAGTATFTVTVTDSETPTAKTATSSSLTIVVNPALSVTTTSLPAGVIGTVYAGATLAAAGGVSPYTWAVTTGSLPTGLTLNAATGAISGTPSGNVTGTISFTVTATDSESPTHKTASANLSITVTATTLKVTTTSLAGGSVNVAYSNQTLTASGGITPITWAVTIGSLPTGLTLNAATGVISGTPTGTFVGTDTFTVTATDTETPTPQTASAQLGITISVATLSVTTSGSLATGVVNSVYPGATLAATGGITPYSWAVTTGSLPAGLTLNAATGAISGTPTAAGTATFTVTVTDSETPTAKTATSSSLTIVVNPALSVTTNSLASGVLGSNYSQTLGASGGITSYTWAVTTGSLPAGLGLNTSTGVISGTPSGTFTGTTNFTVTVTDSESPTHKTASANLSITVSATTLTVTTNSLPSGVINNSYSATLAASGGAGAYTWSLTSGSLPTNLTFNSNGTITGTPTVTGSFPITVKVTDSETPTAHTASANLTLVVNNSAPLQITTSGLPGGVVSIQYSTSAYLSATGGVQPYSWSYTGSLPPGLTLNASTGQITGTPTSTGTFNFTAKVTDSSGPTQSVTANLSITINGGLTITTSSLPNGSIGTQYNATVNASGGLQPYNWSIIGSGSTPPGLNFNNNNNSLNINGQPNTTGTYTFTVQVTDSENTSVSNSYTIVISNQPTGYTVSGTVSYGGSKTGWVYLQLANNGNNCGNCGNSLGTSVKLTSGTGAFTIHGVQPGTYTLQAFMDNLNPAFGAQNASNPTGSVSNVTVVNANINGVSLTLTDPAAVTLSSAPTWKANQGFGAFNGGGLIAYQGIQNNNGVEMATSYTVQWSTSSSFTSIAGSTSFPATGGNDPKIVTGLTNGTTYFFRVQGVAGSSTSNWSAASSALTIGAPTGGNTVSGTVSFSKTATGPLYVGFYDQGTGSVFATVVGSKAAPPHSPAAYSVQVPTGSNYFFFGVIDQANDGLISAPGQISNTNNNNNSAPVVINGPLSNENLTLSSANSVATVSTQTSEQINSNGTSTSYGIGFSVNGYFKLPVAVELATGPTPGVVMPADIANNAFGGNPDRFNFFTSLNGATPHAGDQYTLNVTYSDGTSEVLTVTISAVLNAFATNLAPQGNGASVTPNFSWTDPSPASSYTYQFYLQDQNGNQIWQIPGNNSNSNGFSSSITSITWNVDPTNSGNLPSVSSLNGNSTYYWQITTNDTNGDSAQVQVTFNTAPAPLTLPTPGSVGSAVVGQNFNGSINASGGVGPNYTFSVNSSTVPTNGSQVSIGDGLYVSNTGGNTLSLGGTPTGTSTVTFTVAVTDSASNSVGPFTYTITVNAPQVLSLETTTMPNGDKNWPYNAQLQANGGVEPYTWSYTGTLPQGLSLISTGGISGTPTATGTSSFQITVTDSVNTSVSGNVSITIGNCSNNANLSGNYAMSIQGWTDSSQGEVFTGLAGSFKADGAGNLTLGSVDFNDPSDGYSQLSFAGTYCVDSNNLGVMNINPGGGSTTLAFALQAGGNGNISTYNNGNGFWGSGLLLKQTTSAFSLASITGPYAVGLIGVDSQGGRYGMAGAFSANGTANLSNGELDIDDAGLVNNGNGPTSPLLFTSNDVSSIATTGRGTVGLNVTGLGTLNFAFYVVNASQLLLVETDSVGTNNALLTGQILKQSGTFTNASLNGVSVIALQGVDTSGGSPAPDAIAGFVTTNGSGSFAINADQNDAGTMGTVCSSATYSVSSNGRMTLSNPVQCGGGGGGGHSPTFYLIGQNQAFVIGTDGSVTFGTMVPQTGSGFTVASLSGNYFGGGEQPVAPNGKSQVTAITADGAGNISGTSDQDKPQNCGSGCVLTASSQTLTATYALVSGGPDGKFVVTDDGVPGIYLYMISTTQGVTLPVSSSQNQSSNPNLVDLHK
jgi:Putative Ig domain